MRQQSLAPDSFEIIVVDDGSHPPVSVGSTDWPGDLPALRLLRQAERRGPATARNLGARTATGRYLAFTDDDCRPDSRWLEQLLRELQSHPDVLLGGRVENGETHNAFARFNQALVTTLQQVTAGTPCLFYCSNNLGIAAARFHAFGGFDESFPEAAGEDREFCIRWQQSGNQLRWVPDALVFHHHPQSCTSAWRMHYRYGKAARLVHRRQSPGGGFSRLALFQSLVRQGYAWPLLLSQAAVACGYFGWATLTAASVAFLSVLAAAWNGNSP